MNKGISVDCPVELLQKGNLLKPQSIIRKGMHTYSQRNIGWNLRQLVVVCAIRTELSDIELLSDGELK